MNYLVETFEQLVKFITYGPEYSKAVRIGNVDYVTLKNYPSIKFLNLPVRGSAKSYGDILHMRSRNKLSDYLIEDGKVIELCAQGWEKIPDQLSKELPNYVQGLLDGKIAALHTTTGGLFTVRRITWLPANLKNNSFADMDKSIILGQTLPRELEIMENLHKLNNLFEEYKIQNDYQHDSSIKELIRSETSRGSYLDSSKKPNLDEQEGNVETV